MTPPCGMTWCSSCWGRSCLATTLSGDAAMRYRLPLLPSVLLVGAT
ncbi:TPA: hypothetical protein ACNVWL_003554 [Pseudomonas aeruginosa]|nr:hypothetical protein [Pseudomonas aeruginosa]WEO43440.1 hypothetical protein PUL49_08390 [Pseudomonas aeruginosa]